MYHQTLQTRPCTIYEMQQNGIQSVGRLKSILTWKIMNLGKSAQNLWALLKIIIKYEKLKNPIINRC